MKQVHQFDHHLYHKALERQIGGSLPVFTGYRQRGAGLGSMLGLIGRYILPIIKEHIFPHAKTALMNTVKDVIHGVPVKDAILRQGGDMLQKVATSVENKRQSGKGLAVKKRPAGNSETSVTHKHPPSQQASFNTPRKKAKKSKKRKTSNILSKRDIWDNGLNQ